MVRSSEGGADLRNCAEKMRQQRSAESVECWRWGLSELRGQPWGERRLRSHDDDWN